MSRGYSQRLWGEKRWLEPCEPSGPEVWRWIVGLRVQCQGSARWTLWRRFRYTVVLMERSLVSVFSIGSPLWSLLCPIYPFFARAPACMLACRWLDPVIESSREGTAIGEYSDDGCLTRASLPFSTLRQCLAFRSITRIWSQAHLLSCRPGQRLYPIVGPEHDFL